jgi:hypothetical protein
MSSQLTAQATVQANVAAPPVGEGVLQRKCACGKHAGGGECGECGRRKGSLQRSASGAGHNAAAVPDSVHEVLGSSGSPLDLQTRSYMESRFGHDFSRVRVHTDSRAQESAQAVNALAYTVGRDIVFGAQQYAPRLAYGMHLLAHELTHVVQQRGSHGGPLQTLSIGRSGDPAEKEAEASARAVMGGRAAKPSLTASPSEGGVLRRFETSERGQITNLNAVINTAENIASDRGVAYMMRWGRFTAGAGGSGAIEAVSPSSGSTGSLANRYLYTCRCGLVDMRHFYQLMYIAIVPFQGGNRGATTQGRQHELSAEETSRFAPEDTPSNALGAYFGSQQSTFERQSTFVSNLRSYLQQCRPVDFTTMAPADQDAVVNYYGSRDARGRPSSPNESATPAVLSVAACAGERVRTFPFVIDPTDPQHKTISGVAP